MSFNPKKAKYSVVYWAVPDIRLADKMLTLPGALNKCTTED